MTVISFYLLEQKLQMKCDFEKEFEELRRKYEIKFKELEGEFLEARKNQDITLKFVYAHKILADALMAKYPKVMQQGNCSYPYAVCSNCGNAYAIYYSLDYKVFFYRSNKYFDACNHI